MGGTNLYTSSSMAFDVQRAISPGPSCCCCLSPPSVLKIVQFTLCANFYFYAFLLKCTNRQPVIIRCGGPLYVNEYFSSRHLLIDCSSENIPYSRPDHHHQLLYTYRDCGGVQINAPFHQRQTTAGKFNKSSPTTAIVLSPECPAKKQIISLSNSRRLLRFLQTFLPNYYHQMQIIIFPINNASLSSFRLLSCRPL